MRLVTYKVCNESNRRERRHNDELLILLHFIQDHLFNLSKFIAALNHFVQVARVWRFRTLFVPPIFNQFLRRIQTYRFLFPVFRIAGIVAANRSILDILRNLRPDASEASSSPSLFDMLRFLRFFTPSFRE